MQKHYLPLLLLPLLLTGCKSNLPIPTVPLSVPALFSDHMVLQQQGDVAFWGRATPEEQVSVVGSWGEKVVVKVDALGVWNLKIKTPKAGGPFRVSVQTNGDSIVIKDVLIGEVWLASGQSNMEMPLSGFGGRDTIINSAQEIAAADFPQIRFLNVPRDFSAAPKDSIVGSWKIVTPENAKSFSATAYYYARKLHRELGVPVGIIQSAVGGTPAEAWTSAETLRKMDDFKETVSDLDSIDVVRELWFRDIQHQKIPKTKREWEDIDFGDGQIKMPDYDDSHWTSLEIPGTIDAINGSSLDGAVWIRRKFEVIDTAADYELRLGAIDDMDETYLNGVKVGGLLGADQYNSPRNFMVPKDLVKKGFNSIAIRIFDTGGGGLVQGPVELKNKNTTIDLTGPWASRVVGELVDGEFYTYGPDMDLSKRPKLGSFNVYAPTVLYNAMINPLIPYTIKGAIWYQGEANVSRAEQYKTLFPAMIADWRSKWGYEFPFYFVQLAPFRYDGSNASPALRDAQRLALATPGTGMAITMDIGSMETIHPYNKKEVGKRLARLALAYDYGKNLVPTGPLFKNTSSDGNKLVVSFENANGLTLKRQLASDFYIAGADKEFFIAQPEIVDDKIILSTPKVKDPKFVRYGWMDSSESSLFNSDGLPASPFSNEE